MPSHTGVLKRRPLYVFGVLCTGAAAKGAQCGRINQHSTQSTNLLRASAPYFWGFNFGQIVVAKFLIGARPRKFHVWPMIRWVCAVITHCVRHELQRINVCIRFKHWSTPAINPVTVFLFTDLYAVSWNRSFNSTRYKRCRRHVTLAQFGCRECAS